MDDECVHGLDPTWCSLCLHPEQVAQKGAHANGTYGAIFRAHYNGDCCECGFPIHRGDQVRVVSGPVNNRYAHLACARTAET